MAAAASDPSELPLEAQPLTAQEEEVLLALRNEFGDRATEDEYVRCVRGYVNESPRIPKTADFLRNVLEWRERVAADTLLTADLDEADTYNRCWPSTFGGEDEVGHLVNFEALSTIDTDTMQASFQTELMLLHRARHMEIIQELKKKTSEERGYRIYKHIYVFDLTGLGRKHASSKTLSVLRPIFDLGQLYYPESLWSMYLIEAPWIFRAIWKLVKPWIDPDTVTKIKVLGGRDEYLPAMQAAGIPLESIPTAIGGSHPGRQAGADEFSPAAYRAKKAAEVPEAVPVADPVAAAAADEPGPVAAAELELEAVAVEHQAAEAAATAAAAAAEAESAAAAATAAAESANAAAEAAEAAADAAASS